MFLIINGERTDCRSNRLAALIHELGHDGPHVAVAVNDEVVTRARWEETALADGDAIEIITPRQGG